METDLKKVILGKKLSSEEIKKIELEMLLYIDSVCRNNGIKYSIIAGTMLGAIRHGGFIPWDDDIDICVPMPDYDKLLRLLKESERYKIRCDYFENNYYYWHAKLVDNNTIAIEKKKPFDREMGVWVDIFPLCGIPNNINYESFLHELDKLNKRVFSSVNLNYMWGGGSLLKTIAKALIKAPYGLECKVRGTKHWKELRRALYIKQPFEDASHVGIVPTLYGDKTIYRKQLFEKYTDICFEGFNVMCIEKWEEYLRGTYGDYMTPPPVEQRQASHFKAYYIK